LKKTGALAAVLAVAVIALSAAVAPPSARAEEASAVRAEGMAVKTAVMAEVKKKAVDRALANAVGKALETLITKETIEGTPGLKVLVDKAVYSRADAFVTNYRVVAEGWMTHMDLSTVPAEDLEQDEPEAALDAAGGGGDAPEPGGVEDETPAWVEAYHIQVEASIDMAGLRRVVERIAPDNGRSSSEITVSILDVADYRTYNRLVRSIRRVPGVEELSYSSFYRGRIVMKAATALPTRTLIKDISKKAGRRFEVSPGGLRRIIIRPAAGRRKKG